MLKLRQVEYGLIISFFVPEPQPHSRHGIILIYALEPLKHAETLLASSQILPGLWYSPSAEGPGTHQHWSVPQFLTL